MIARLGPSFVVVVGLCVTALVYANGLSGPFVLDDFGNIVENYKLHIDTFSWASLRDAALSSRASTLQRPLAMLSFAFNAQGQELSAFSFKATNLAIHLVNGVLVYILAAGIAARLMVRDGPALGTRHRWIASVVALVWLLHPIQLTGVLYVVQRMTSLSALFVLLGLIGYLWSRLNLERYPRRSIVGMALALVSGLAFGVACKENAVVIVPLAALIEYTAFSRANLARPARRALYTLYAALLVIPMLIAVFAIALNPGLVLDAYNTREFGPGERLLTQGRVLFHYLQLIFVPRLSDFGIFRDAYVASADAITPFSTALALLAWAALGASAWRCRYRQPALSFGIGWFLISHSVESSVFALELVFEHRNYLPLVGVVFATVWYAALALQRTKHCVRNSTSAALLVVLALGAITTVRAEIWSTSAGLTEFLARRHPDSGRAQHARTLLMLRQGNSLPSLYSAFQGVGVLDAQLTQPLIEMWKILNAHRTILERTQDDRAFHTGREVGIGSRAGADVMPFTLTGAGNHDFPRALVDADRAASLIRAELMRRLSDYAVTGEVLRTLVGHQRCVRQEIDVCKGDLAFIIALHEQALSNGRMFRLTRAALHFSYARLLFFAGRSHAAAANANEAIRLEPGDVGARIEYAQLLMMIGRLDGADTVLTDVEKHLMAGGRPGVAVQAVRVALDAAVASAQMTSIKN